MGRGPTQNHDFSWERLNFGNAIDGIDDPFMEYMNCKEQLTK
jgi:hypothetical protein